jgi:hypothetical protein
MAEEFAKKATSLFSSRLNAGVSFIQQGLMFKGNDDSSDDERRDVQDTEDFITTGDRGILTFPVVVSVRKGCSMKLNLNLYKAKITLCYEDKKKVYPCSEILRVEKEGPLHVLMEMRRSLEVKVRQKRLTFETEAMADQFQQYIDFINEFGTTIKQSFNMIDYTRCGHVCKENLRTALKRVDLRVDDESLEKMLAYSTICDKYSI